MKTTTNPKLRKCLEGRAFLGFRIIRATDMKSVEMATGLARATGSTGATYEDGSKLAEVSRA